MVIRGMVMEEGIHVIGMGAIEEEKEIVEKNGLKLSCLQLTRAISKVGNSQPHRQFLRNKDNRQKVVMAKSLMAVMEIKIEIATGEGVELIVTEDESVREMVIVSKKNVEQDEVVMVRLT